MPEEPGNDELVQVVMYKTALPWLERMLAYRGCKLFRIPLDPDAVDLPTFGITPTDAKVAFDQRMMESKQRKTTDA